MFVFAVSGETIVEKNGGPPSLNLATEPTGTHTARDDADSEQVDAPVVSEPVETAAQVEEVKKTKAEKVHRFGKMFKKKVQPDVKSAPKEESPSKGPPDVSPAAPDPQLVSV